MNECVNIPHVLLNDKKLSLSDVRVYAALKEHADEKQQCSLTREMIEKYSSVQRVSRYTKNLEEHGYIRVDKTGEGNRNTYTLLNGKDETQSPQQITLKTFAKDYLEYSSGTHTKKTSKTYKTALQEFIRIEGNRCLNTIGIREIEHFLSAKKNEASAWSARSYYIALRSAFEKAVQWELIKENPFRKVKKPKPPEVLPVFFTDTDFQSMLSIIEETDFRELCIVGLLTGLRLGELLALRWQDIDFNAKVILVQNSDSFTTKSKKNRPVSLSEDAVELLSARKENCTV